MDTMQPAASTSPSSRIGAPITMEQRKWEHVSWISHVHESWYPVSKRVTHLSRHHPEFREEDGVRMLIQFQRFQFPEDVSKWRQQTWIDRQERCSNKTRCEYSLNSEGEFNTCELCKDILAESVLIPKLQSNAPIPHGWTHDIDHVGASLDCRSRRRQTCFFTAVDTMYESRAVPSHEIDQPRMALYKTKRRRTAS